ncbi:Wzz/FepE/Etk N-terminal domain-containing protein [Morganella psychrotolerans]|uniref:FepE n=1 Tax=Morganella psychrotolerans TaxID=368603 RepID=A0A1B8HSU2_9GAMM|nr:Wzz/FepE/Etk N-terminal domain-containing protein [Morganella psychrotolerans]OBU12945.1 FepE [Morganella psychrotolerans]
MMSTKEPVNLNDDEIDIIDLIKLLYRYKVFIIIVTLLFTVAGFGLSKLLPQKWTSTAEIAAVNVRDMPLLNKLRLQMEALNVPAVSDLPAAFNVLRTVWQSPDIQQNFLRSAGNLTSSGAFGFQGKEADLLMPATARVSFTADDPQTAQRLLSDYLDYTRDYSRTVLQTQLQENLDAALNKGQSEYSVALVQVEHERDQTLAYLSMAEKIAGNSPAVAPQSTASDPVAAYSALGRPAIAEMKNALKNMDLSKVNARLQDKAYVLQVINNVDPRTLDIMPFSVKEAPALPVVKDGPGAKMYILASAFLGFILSVLAVFSWNMFVNRKKSA